jgi:putative transposase
MKQLNFCTTNNVSLARLKDMFLEDMNQGSRRFLRELLNGFMEMERDEFLEYGFMDRDAGAKDYRNGYYERTIRSCLGLIEHVRVPRTRSGMFYPQVIERSKQIASETAQGLAKMYLRGVSTHNVGEVLESLLGYKVSSSAVSRVTKGLSKDVGTFYKRELTDDIKILFLDGIYLKSKGILKSRKKPVLVAYGIYTNGRREFLHFRLAKSESENEWLKVVNELYRKGLEGKELELIVTDGCPGLKNAIETVYPYAKHQHCWAHKMRNVANKCKKVHQQACVKDAQKIYYAKSKHEAVIKFKFFKASWNEQCPGAVMCIEKDLEDLLHFYDFDEVLWKKIRTTNVIERGFGEVRRRTKVMGCFPNDGSCERMVYALFAYFNNKWAYKRSFIKISKQLVA